MKKLSLKLKKSSLRKLEHNKKYYYGLFIKEKWVEELIYCRNEYYMSATSRDEFEKKYDLLFNYLESDSKFKAEFSTRELSIEARAMAISLLCRNYHHHKLSHTILFTDENEFKNAINEISKAFLIAYKVSTKVCF